MAIAIHILNADSVYLKDGQNLRGGERAISIAIQNSDVAVNPIGAAGAVPATD